MEIVAAETGGSAIESGSALRGYAHMAATAFFVFLGSAAALAIHNGVRPPTRAVVVILLGVTLWGAFVPRVSRLNLLPRILIFIYALPFSALLGYLFDPGYLWVFTLRGYPIGQDPDVMSILTLTGLAGICGFVAGLHLVCAFTAREVPVEPARASEAPNHTMGTIMFGALALLAAGLSGSSHRPQLSFSAGSC